MGHDDNNEGVPKYTIDNNEELRLAAKRIELPSFHGEDPWWVSIAKTYFVFQATPREMRIQLAQISMEGPI